MKINKIALENFRNYEIQEIKLDENINVFYGNNAQGKTNILEALYFCAFGRSFRTYKDAELINFEKDTANIKVEFEKNNREQSIEVGLNKKDRKQIKLNDIKLNKNSELLGNLNLVLFSPDDTVVLKESPASRRKFLDILISQLRPNYAHVLGKYNKILENRNSIIKSQKVETIEVWDEQLADAAEKINSYRVEYINKLQQYVDKIAPSLTNCKERLVIKYKTSFKDKENFLKLLKQNLRNDLFRGYTTSGIHRDDFELLINDKELNLYGSQGQHRTSILALKFAELEIIKEEINENPVLLLDDITSELDLERIGQIFKKISGFQVLITCTDANILRNIESLTNEVKLYKINSGRVD